MNDDAKTRQIDRDRRWFQAAITNPLASVYLFSRGLSRSQPTLRELSDFGTSQLKVSSTFMFAEMLMVQISNNSLSDFVRQIASGYKNLCQSRNITLELDIDEVSTAYDKKTTHSAIIAMIENAIDSMPNGGELEATLIDGNGQWELEIADSGSQSSVPSNTDSQTQPSSEVADSDLFHVAPFQANQHLRRLNNISILLNATVQTWNCPLGGTAHVLVVPKSSHRQDVQHRQDTHQRKVA